MASYIEPIRFALIVFPFLALAISAIFFIYEYRKYGTFLLTRAVILYSFVFYLLCAYFLVILPLPTKEAVAKMTGPKMELHLFASWENFRANTVLVLSDPSTYLPAMRQSVFLEPLFNVFLLLPFGIYLRYYFRLSFVKTVIASFCLSLFFELTQLTGLYFIYPRPYRLFDVNDLLTNTFGGMLGYLVTPIFTFMLPTRARMDEVSYEKGKTVSLTRRLVAYLIDWFFLSICTSIIGVVAGLSIGSSEFTSYSCGCSCKSFSISCFFLSLQMVEHLGKKSSGSSLLKMGGNESDFVHCSFDMRISISYFMG